MELNVEKIRSIFNEYNESIFKAQYDCTLPMPKFVISGRAHNWLGQFSYKRIDRIGTSYVIKISKNFNYTNIYELASVVVHEMIHEYIQFKSFKDTNSHGYVFNSIKNNINKNFKELKIQIRCSFIYHKTNKTEVMLFTDKTGKRCFTFVPNDKLIDLLTKKCGKYGDIEVATCKSNRLNNLAKSRVTLHYLYVNDEKFYRIKKFIA